LQGPGRFVLGDCEDRSLVLWAGGEGDVMVSDFNFGETAMIRDLWLLEVDGQILAIEHSWFPETPGSTLQELQALVDSMHITRL
jgi:hypothetical protein